MGFMKNLFGSGNAAATNPMPFRRPARVLMEPLKEYFAFSSTVKTEHGGDCPVPSVDG